MILVDTSVWVDHLRRGNPDLAERLEAGTVLGHKFVAGELACGSLRNRRLVLDLIEELPQAVQAEHEEVMRLVELRRLMGRGLGYVDVHLLTSAILSRAKLWTLDRRLAATAHGMDVSA